MSAPDPIASRLIGTLFVERGLVSESQVRVALEIQRETGEQLGQILVQRFGVSRRELARVVAEQWKDISRGAPGKNGGPNENWRPLGEIFVTRGFISEEELDEALKRQRKTGERLGEALVGLGVISKFELAGALAEQMATLGPVDDDTTDEEQANVVQLPARQDEAADASSGPTESDEPVAVEEEEPGSPTEVVQPEPREEPRPEPTLASVLFVLEEPTDFQPELEDVEVVAGAEAMAEAEREAEPRVEPEPEVEPMPDPAYDEPDPELVAEAVPEPADDEPEPRFELEAEVPSSIGSWHLLVPEPEPVLGACVAFAPSSSGYVLVPLPAVPSAGETIDVDGLGELYVLRVGASPLPDDTRLCAFVEEAVVPALAVD